MDNYAYEKTSAIHSREKKDENKARALISGYIHNPVKLFWGVDVNMF